MSMDWQQQIDRYLDDDLFGPEFLAFQEWLASDPAHMQRFVEAAMLHDRLHGLMLARTSIDAIVKQQKLESKTLEPSKRPILRRVAGLLALATTILFVVVLWRGNTPAFAAHSELRKMIAAQVLSADRAYLIEVESSVVGGARQRRKLTDEIRPPKPPMDGARLFVRGNNMFVLERTLSTGELFVTGCDGKEVWSIPPKGAVRISEDLQKFNRDVPGHEYSMSLCNLSDALNQLKIAYEIDLLPLDNDDFSSSDAEATRLLVATKKSRSRGPRRVEITYTQESRWIEQIRFIDMPYGSDRLTIRMVLVEHSVLADDFFQHRSHHADDRKVIQE